MYEVLQRHNAAFCMYELNRFRSPEVITGDWAYIRLHGPGGPYQGSYSGEALAEWARKIRGWRARLKHVYVYFDNDQAGYAAQNALELQRLTGAGRKPAGRVA